MVYGEEEETKTGRIYYTIHFIARAANDIRLLFSARHT